MLPSLTGGVLQGFRQGVFPSPSWSGCWGQNLGAPTCEISSTELTAWAGWTNSLTPDKATISMFKDFRGHGRKLVEDGRFPQMTFYPNNSLTKTAQPTGSPDAVHGQFLQLFLPNSSLKMGARPMLNSRKKKHRRQCDRPANEISPQICRWVVCFAKVFANLSGIVYKSLSPIF